MAVPAPWTIVHRLALLPLNSTTYAENAPDTLDVMSNAADPCALLALMWYTETTGRASPWTHVADPKEPLILGAVSETPRAACRREVA